MMMIPRRNSFNLLDEFFGDDPFFSSHESKLMRTDIKEKGDKYLIDIDLPGYEKENIKIDVEDGYLTINASTEVENDSDDDSNYVRKERYSGSCTRSFYVGEDVESEDIKASFKNGILKLEVPKKDAKKEVPTKKYVQIGD